MNTIYISGGITGKIDTAFVEFEKAEKKLTKLGFKVVNPMAIKEHRNHDQSWEAFMRVDIKHLMGCNAIYMLKGWEQSRGARLEYTNAIGLNFKVVFEDFEEEDVIETDLN